MSRFTVDDTKDREIWLVRMPVDLNPEVLKEAWPKLKLKRRAAGDELSKVGTHDGKIFAIKNGSEAEGEGVRCAFPKATSSDSDSDKDGLTLGLVSRPCDRIITVTTVTTGKIPEAQEAEGNEGVVPPASFRLPYQAPKQRKNLKAVFRPIGSTLNLKKLAKRDGDAKSSGVASRKRSLSSEETSSGKKAKKSKVGKSAKKNKKGKRN